MACLTPWAQSAPAARYRARDGTTMLLVPAGPFWMGSNDVANEKPRQRITLPAYYIAQTAVTNAQFERFVRATHHRSPGDWHRYYEWWGPQAPVVDVTYEDALAYCKWAGLRLPTEAEHEKAARGTDGRLYPWGNDFDPTRCRTRLGWSKGQPQGPVAVGSYPTGASPCGALDMCGNVWEWTSTEFRPYPYVATDGRESQANRHAQRVWRGSSWYCNVLIRLRCSYRQPSPPDFHRDSTGFRCASSAP
jgi:formylglycine-generating enzyme required for sulfatase activity